MRIEHIYETWGSKIYLDSPQEFFNYTADYWRTLMYERKLVFFKQVEFTIEEYALFSLMFGQPWQGEEYTYSREAVETVDTKHGPLFVSPFNNRNTTLIDDREMPWHSDIPNRSFRPFPFRSLWITKNPNPEVSGITRWMNLEEGIKHLTPEMQSLIPRVKVMQQSWYNEGTDLQEHPMSKIHPITGKESLRLNYYNWGAVTNAWIRDVKIDDELQGHCFLIRQWLTHLQQVESLKYYHKWDLYDIAIYDNWTFLHARTALKFDPKQYIRHFYRINIDHLTDQEWSAHKQKYSL
jgi:alpha-ketoglutarate-dependent taurine dioxygenase